MAEDISLEERVNSMTVSYNTLPWFFYPINWKANFPLRKWPGFEKLPVPHRFLARTSYNGKRVGRIAKVKEINPDRRPVYYRAGYDDTSNSLDHIIEWAEDTVRENQLNDDNLTMDRKTALSMSLHNGQRTVTMIQHDKNIFDSWYALPFKLPFYLATLPLSMISRSVKAFGGRELIELGKLYNLEGTDIPGDLTLDQNLIREIMTLGLGKYYEVRDGSGKIIANIKRNPLIKLLTLGLKNHYKIKFQDANEKHVKLMYGVVDYLQNEFNFRRNVPKKDVGLEDLFRYGN